MSKEKTKPENKAWCEENISDDTHYYYPPELQSRLLAACKRRDIDTVNNVLDLLRQENKATPVFLLKFLFMELRCTMFKAMNAARATAKQIAEYDEKLIHFAADLNSLCFVDCVKELLVSFLLSCEAETDLRRRMLNFIEDNYKNPMLGRQMFAEHFYISAQYVTLFFKQHTGFSFHNYVLEVRMNAAYKLLKDTDYMIDKIAEKTGYISAASFRRAFKDYAGMSPTEFKRSIS